MFLATRNLCSYSVPTQTSYAPYFIQDLPVALTASGYIQDQENCEACCPNSILKDALFITDVQIATEDPDCLP